jgi:hypothetical protein
MGKSLAAFTLDGDLERRNRKKLRSEATKNTIAPEYNIAGRPPIE